MRAAVGSASTSASASASSSASCLYVGSVMHRRHAPRTHSLQYSVFSVFIDLDQIANSQYDENMNRKKTAFSPYETANGSAATDVTTSATIASASSDSSSNLSTSPFSRWFSHNRFNLYSFHDADHGDGSATPLRGQVERLLAHAGVDLHGGAIRLLCMPRVLGYVFNPLSVYYCYEPAGQLTAVLYEVNNTFGQRHTYVFPISTACPKDQADVIEQQCQKRFHVSPFLDMNMQYRFRLTPPAEKLTLSIRTSSQTQPMLDATYQAKRVPLADTTWLRLFATHPLLTLKVIVGIHWEALQVWRKGAGYRPCPPPGPSLSVMDADGNLLDISSKQVS